MPPGRGRLGTVDHSYLPRRAGGALSAGGQRELESFCGALWTAWVGDDLNDRDVKRQSATRNVRSEARLVASHGLEEAARRRGSELLERPTGRRSVGRSSDQGIKPLSVSSPRRPRVVGLVAADGRVQLAIGRRLVADCGRITQAKYLVAQRYGEGVNRRPDGSDLSRCSCQIS